jgi:hypothetical protein
VFRESSGGFDALWPIWGGDRIGSKTVTGTAVVV